MSERVQGEGVREGRREGGGRPTCSVPAKMKPLISVVKAAAADQVAIATRPPPANSPATAGRRLEDSAMYAVSVAQ